MGEEEYTMTEAEIAAALKLWGEDFEANPDDFATTAQIKADALIELQGLGRVFLDYLAKVRCERIGL